MSIGMAEPDASVLLKGLDKITGPIVRANHELSFRVSLIRSTLQVDVSPSATTVTTFLQHLQAEMEQQARLGAARGGHDPATTLRALSTGVDPQVSVAPSTTTTPPTKPPGNGCKFFLSERGCRRGNSCKFPHTWSAIDKASRSKRCLCCGGVGHKARECKAPGGGQSTPKGTPKAASLGASDTGATSSSTTTTEAPTRRVNFDPGDIQAKVLQVMGEISHLPVFAPLVAALECWRDNGFYGLREPKGALLDSGATHVLRQPRDRGEWDQARRVNVQLAGDAVAAMKQTLSGSLLSSEELAQVIVPLGKVISNLGYKLDWTADHCVLHGEDGEEIPLQVTNGCPEVSEVVAQRLIHKLENQQLPELKENTTSSMKALKKIKMSWWTCLEEYVKAGDLECARAAVEKAIFLDHKDAVKDRLLTRLPRLGVWELMKGLSINRRARKRLLRADEWILRWDPPTVERSRDAVKHLSYLGSAVYVNMNTMLVNNEFSEVWKVIQWAAFNGVIGTVVVKDCPPTPLDQLIAGPHRSKVLFIHALASVGRQAKAGGAVRLYVEDLERIQRAHAQGDGAERTATRPAWTQCKDTVEYMNEMGLVDVSITKFSAERHVRLAKLSSDAAWRLHVARNHQPFRRDCAVCVRNSAAGHQHRTTAHPMAYSLSVDVVGPIKGYGRSPDGKFFKYFVIGAFRIPRVDGAHGHGDVRGHPLPPGDPEEEEERLSDDERDLPEDGLEAGGVSSDEVRDEEKRWEELKATFKEPIQTTTLYFAIPVNNKKAATAGGPAYCHGHQGPRLPGDSSSFRSRR